MWSKGTQGPSTVTTPLKYSEVVRFDSVKKCGAQLKGVMMEPRDSSWGIWGSPEGSSINNNGCSIWSNNHDDLDDHKEDRVTHCCVPTGCSRYFQEPISVEDPGDAVKVLCSNESCTDGEWMHWDCFQDWEEKILSYLRNSGRARGWSEKQRHQNLWTKKGYDLAFKMCDCKCGRGYLRVDQMYAATRADEEKKVKKNKKKEKTTTTTGIVTTGSNNAQQLHQQLLQQLNANGREMRSPLRIHRSSCSSGGSWSGSSPSSSAGTTPVTPPGIFMPPGLTGGWDSRKSSLGSTTSGGFGGTHFELVLDEHHAAVGHMFQHRKDLSVFHCLPRRLQNTHQIRMEDEGPHGNDEIRCQVLTCLSSARATSVRCVVCCCDLTVYDKYPIIDGTFFLSPVCYPATNEELRVTEPVVSTHHRGNGNRSNHFSSTPAPSRKLYLNAVCMYCMEGGGVQVAKATKALPATTISTFPTATDGRRGLRLTCRMCHKPWSGTSLIVGTMYAYDVFAAAPCCGARLRCNQCRQLLCEPMRPLKFFSDYSRLVRCGSCGADDNHFVKPLDDVFVKNMP